MASFSAFCMDATKNSSRNGNSIAENKPTLLPKPPLKKHRSKQNKRPHSLYTTVLKRNAQQCLRFPVFPLPYVAKRKVRKQMISPYAMRRLHQLAAGYHVGLGMRGGMVMRHTVSDPLLAVVEGEEVQVHLDEDEDPIYHLPCPPDNCDNEAVQVDLHMEGLSPGAILDEYVYIVNVRSQKEGDKGVNYTIRQNQPFRAIYRDYATKVDYEQESDLTIKKGDAVIAMGATPLEHGIVSSDVLYVHGKDPNDNMDTSCKIFYVRDIMTYHNVHKVCGKLRANLNGLYKLWTDLTRANKKQLILTHDNVVVTDIHTVANNEMKNKDVVFAYPLSYFHPKS